MKISLTQELTDYMKAKGKYGIIVEVVSSDSSDFEVTELHTHFVSEKQAALFIRRKGFHPVEADGFSVLLPNYRLQLSGEIRFGLKKLGPIRLVQSEGIAL